MSSVLNDDVLRQMLKAHLESGGNMHSLQVRMVHLKRKDDEAARRADQIGLGLRDRLAGADKEILAHLVAEFRRPITAAEKAEAHGGLDMLLLSYQECLDAGDLEDALWAAARLVRKMWVAQFGHLQLDPNPATWPDTAKADFGRGVNPPT
jgi:hypothetical protein